MPQHRPIRTPIGTLTRRGELVAVVLALILLVALAGLVGGIETGTLGG